jgi:hypothetical protein
VSERSFPIAIAPIATINVAPIHKMILAVVLSIAISFPHTQYTERKRRSGHSCAATHEKKVREFAGDTGQRTNNQQPPIS